MKKHLLLCAALGVGIACFAYLPKAAVTQTTSGIDRWNVQHQFDEKVHQHLFGEEKTPAGVQVRIPQYEWEDTDTVTYFAVAQDFKENYIFNYSGGEIKTYDVGVVRDGDKVTFTNLFNLYNPNDWSISYDLPVEGVYDEAAHTITIPTPTNFDEATFAASIMGGWYMGALQAGEVDENGKMAVSDKLVFNVEGDFERIYTDQNFGVSEYTKDGSANYGFYVTYRSFSINLPKPGAKLITFNDYVVYDETFPEVPETKNITIINIGQDPTEYVVTVESDGDAFSCEQIDGTIEGLSKVVIPVTLNSSAIGEYEGLMLVESEDDEPLMILLEGGIKPYPDFSQIISGGEFTYITNIEYPFDLETLEDGTLVAYSGTHGSGGSSYVTFNFNVPEGYMGVLSWKGMSFNSGGWRGGMGGMYIDTLDYPPYATFSNESDIIDGSEEMAPGDHFIRFQYDQNYYTGNPADGLYVSDLNLELVSLDADAAQLVTPEVFMGNYLMEGDNPVEGEGFITIQNRGKNVLKVTDVKFSNPDFETIGSADEATTLKNLNVPVYFKTVQLGTISSEVEITTTAGTFNATISADIMEYPDYSQIVTEGLEYLTFTANASHPFIVEDGQAFNANYDKIDTEQSLSSFRIDFTIPEGKLGYMSWDGYCEGTPETVESYWTKDYGMISMSHPMTFGTTSLWGEHVDASSAGFDDFWQTYLSCTPGNHYIEFQYNQGGDNTSYGENRLVISNFKLHVIDAKEHGVMAVTEEVSFEPTYVGDARFTTATVRLRNTGTEDLHLLDCTDFDSAFSYNVPSWNITRFNETIDVPVFFFPKKEGVYDEDMVIHTDGGDVTVKCHGETISSEGIIYPGDFEDGAYGWLIYDRDKDGECWNLGSNLWGTNDDYVHEGHDCLASISKSYSLGSITPDNITISPAMEIPENGAKLTYFVAAFSDVDYAEHYSIYISDQTNFEAISDQEPVISETIDVPAVRAEGETKVGGWIYHELDLSDYAGQTIYFFVRHHDCTGEYILRLDDFFVWGDQTAVPNISAKGIERQEIYDLNGIRHQSLQKGVNIIRTYNTDGTVTTSKFILNK